MPTKNCPAWRTQVIEPKIAANILEANLVDIPKLRNTFAVRSYAKEMSDGNWALNGDAIIFGERDQLLDGRLRLLASVVSNCPFPTFVVSGISGDSKVTIDSHRKRRTADVLHIIGHDESANLASTCNSIMQIVDAQRIRKDPVVSTLAIKAFVDANPKIRDSIVSVGSMRLVASRSIMAAFHFLARRIDPARCDEFFRLMDDPAPIKGDRRPAVALGRAIRALPKEMNASVKRDRLHLLLVKGWNADMDGALVSRLTPSEDEEIPPMKGLALDLFDAGDAAPAPRDVVARNYLNATHDTEISLNLRTITPERAEELLENNGPDLEEATRNRKQSAATINLYAKDMTADKWQVNGQAIKISKTGRLLDGQHRLAACIQANKPFDTIVINGLPDDVFATYDLQNKKKFASTVADVGYGNSSLVAAAIRLIWRHENCGLHSSAYPTNSELLESLEKHGRHIGRSISYGNKRCHSPFSSYSTIAGIHYIISNLPGRSREFWDKFETGADLGLGHPVLTLRKRLQADKDLKTVFACERSRLIFITTAWKAFVEGRNLPQIRNGLGFDTFYTEPHQIDVDRQMAA